MTDFIGSISMLHIKSQTFQIVKNTGSLKIRKVSSDISPILENLNIMDINGQVCKDKQFAWQILHKFINDAADAIAVFAPFLAHRPNISWVPESMVVNPIKFNM